MKKALTYSNNALLNRVVFLAKRNEFIVFVEDDNKEYEYERIFERLLEVNEMIIKDIFPTNGKPGLKNAFYEYGAFYNGKPAIYIADCDFDVLLKRKMIKNAHFIYLERYNIEGYYIDEDAILKYMIGKMKCRRKEVIERIDLEQWRQDTYGKLEELFILFAVSQEVIPQEETLGKKPYTFLQEDGLFDEKKIQDYRNELSSKIGSQTINNIYNKYKKYYNSYLGGDAKRIICGKYLLASLTRYLRYKTNTTFKEDDFRYYLVGEFDIEEIRYISDRMSILKKTKV